MIRKFYDTIVEGSGGHPEFKERINYVIENGFYCGHMVNLPIVAQAKSLEELKSRMLIMANLWVEMMQKTLGNSGPFEFNEMPNIEPNDKRSVATED